MGDFNGDGKLDLAVTGYGVSHFAGGRRGQLHPASSLAVGGSPYSVAVGDFNGDGNLDLAVPFVGGRSSGVSILLGYGGGYSDRLPRMDMLAPWWWATSTATATWTWPSPTHQNTVSILLGGNFTLGSIMATGVNPVAIGGGRL